MYSRSKVVLPFLHKASAFVNGPGSGLITQVIHAPLFAPKAISHAGSSDWKNSSGWKKVSTLSAFRILNATRNKKRSREGETCLTVSVARRRRLLASSRLMELSMPNLVEACDIGVVGGDDIARHLPCARMQVHRRGILFEAHNSNPAGQSFAKQNKQG